MESEHRLGQHSQMIDLAEKARRRYLANLIFDQASTAISAAMAGAILLLVLGTQILDWYWPLVLFAGGVAITVRKTLSRMPSPYRLMQMIDGRLGLHDSLSTAFHFSRIVGAPKCSETMREAQHKQAEELCRAVDVRRAVPFSLPRGIYAAGVLALVAGSLFALRYGLRRSLDLRPPMSQAMIDFFRPSPVVASARKKPEPQLPQNEAIGLSVSQGEEQPGETQQAPDSALSVVETPEVNNEALSVQSEKASLSNASAREGTENQSEGSDNEQSSSGNSEETGKEDSSSKAASNAAPESAPPQGEQASSNPPGENSSLMDKFRDAMANLLAKMKVPPKPGDGQQSSSASRGGQRASRSQQSTGQKGMENQGRPQADGMPSADQQGDQEGEGGEPTQSAQGKGGDKSSDQPGKNEARSGMGKQDGSKDVREAEQLAAMGKISEIIGKRAANITGEVMVEVASGKQRLRTAYTQSSATHREAGGEVHRDEVPLLLQHYVQQYFEEVRKTAPAESQVKPESTPGGDQPAK